MFKLGRRIIEITSLFAYPKIYQRLIYSLFQLLLPLVLRQLFNIPVYRAIFRLFYERITKTHALGLSMLSSHTRLIRLILPLLIGHRIVKK